MLPIQLIACLFTATIVGATANFTRQSEYTPILWYMYLYLVGYRTKVFLDDLVYYQSMKAHGVGGGDPVIGLASWILWIALAIAIGREQAYFGLTSVTFGLGIVWVLIARANVRKLPGDGPGRIVADIKAAHNRWLVFNVIPCVVAGLYFLLYFFHWEPSWSNVVSWVGPILMAGALLCDACLGYRFMFQLDNPQGGPGGPGVSPYVKL